MHLRKPQQTTLKILEAFLSIGKWQGFYQQNAKPKVRNLDTYPDFSICFICCLGLCVQLGSMYSVAYLNSLEGAGESLGEFDRLFSR